MAWCWAACCAPPSATCWYLPRNAALQTFWYDAVGSAAVVVVWVNIFRHRPTRRLGWMLVAGGFTAWALGDILYSVENVVLELGWYPAPSDAVYLAAYGLLAVGLLFMVRSRHGMNDRTAILDACIIAVGAAVLAVVTVVQPVTVDDTLGLLGKVVSSVVPDRRRAAAGRGDAAVVRLRGHQRRAPAADRVPGPHPGC